MPPAAFLGTFSRRASLTATVARSPLWTSQTRGVSGACSRRPRFCTERATRTACPVRVTVVTVANHSSEHFNSPTARIQAGATALAPPSPPHRRSPPSRPATPSRPTSASVGAPQSSPWRPKEQRPGPSFPPGGPLPSSQHRAQARDQRIVYWGSIRHPDQPVPGMTGRASAMNGPLNLAEKCVRTGYALDGDSVGCARCASDSNPPARPR